MDLVLLRLLFVILLAAVCYFLRPFRHSGGLGGRGCGSGCRRRGHRFRTAGAGADAAAADRRGGGQRARHLWRGAVLPGAALRAALRRELRRAADLRAPADDLRRLAGRRQQGRPAESGSAGHGVLGRQALPPQRQSAGHERDYRRPHRRHRRGRLYRRHAGGAGVRAARAAGGGRLHRRLEAPARPPRPGHAAAHAVQRQNPGADRARRLSLRSAKWT